MVPSNHDEKSTVPSVPSLNARWIRYSPRYSARVTVGRNVMRPSLLQGSNPLQRRARLQAVPVGIQLGLMCRRPLRDQAQSCARPQGACKHLPIEGECRLLALVLGMEVSDAVLAVKHADDD